MTFSATCKMAMVSFLKVALSKCMDFSAHKTLIPMLNFTNVKQKLLYWSVVLTRAEIDCNLNQIAQKIALVSPSTRRIGLEKKEHVILPSRPRYSSCLFRPTQETSQLSHWLFLLSQRNSLSRWGSTLCLSWGCVNTQCPSQPSGQKWRRSHLSGMLAA